MNESNDKSIDLELQVRLLNLVLGEASDFERDQLQQLMEQRPELVEYHQHLEHLHGLLSVVGGGQWQPNEDESQADATWTLPELKRQQLLAVLDGNQPQAVSPTAFVVKKSGRWKVSSPWTATLLTVCASTILLGFLMWPAVEAARSVSTKLGASSAVESEAALTVNPSSGELYDADAIAAYSVPSRRSEVHLNRMSESGDTSAPAVTRDLAETAGRPFSHHDASGGFGMGGADSPVMKDRLAAGVEDGAVSSEELSRLERVDETVEEIVASDRWDDAVDAKKSSGSQSAQGFSGGTRLGFALESAEASNSDGTRFEPPPADAVRELESAQTDPFSAGPATEHESRPQIAQLGKQPAIGDLYFQGGRQSQSTAPASPSSPASPAGDSASVELPKLEGVDWFADSPHEPTVSLVEGLGQKTDSNFATNAPALGGVVDPKQQVELGIRLSSNVPSIIIEREERSHLSNQNMIDISSLSGSVSSNRGIESTTAVEQDKSMADRVPARELAEQSASDQAFSTFSLHVSDVSFKLAQESLNQGKIPPAESVRIEEFVNALDYRDPLPSSDEKVACQVEQAIHPFLMQRNLLRVSMRTSASGRSSSTPLRLTLLLDNSGSMERPDRRQIVQRGLQTLVQQLSGSDQVTLISFANTPRLLADKVSGSLGQTLLQIVESLPSEGGTNIEAALRLAGEKALEQQTAGAQNRIVLMTDGAVNLGDADPNRLARMITELRDLGIAFDAAGISSQGLNDDVLEALTRRGDGRYYLLESVDSAGEDFSNQIAGALRPSARNVKVQVEFNPNRVGRYQLLGFESHRLKKEDFRNDSVDAAELSASEAGVAVYHFEVLPNGSGDVGNVSVRFQDLNTGEMVEQRWPILYVPSVPRLDAASPSLKMASVAALFAAKLQGGPLADVIDLEELNRVLSTLTQSEMNQPRAEQLRTMIEQAKGIL